MNKDFYIAIMAGGIGSRFWPASRASRPKQFLDITGNGASLLQMTYNRLKGFVPPENILIVSNRDYAELIMEQLPLLNRNQLLLEPSRNNTAPCVAFTALHLQAKNPNAVFAVLPADQVIQKEQIFINAMQKGFEKAQNAPAIVTLGIQPSRPDTGYGYIDFDKESESNGVYAVRSFTEKPSLEKAKEYLSKGSFVWNAGIFIWSVATVLENFRTSSPNILLTLSKDVSKYGTEQEQEYIKEVYPQTDRISVDYAILEKANNVFTIPVDIGWSDLGTWNSLYAYLEKDEQDNVILTKNKKVADTSGTLVRLSNSDKLVVIKGLKDFIIIDEEDVLLIYPRTDEQEVKKVRSDLSDERFA